MSDRGKKLQIKPNEYDPPNAMLVCFMPCEVSSGCVDVA